jgi:hypothetical protein
LEPEGRLLMENQREWTLGAQKLRFEPPDTLWVTFQGKLSLEEVRLLVDCYRELGRSGPFFLVGDLREGGQVDREIQRRPRGAPPRPGDAVTAARGRRSP